MEEEHWEAGNITLWLMLRKCRCALMAMDFCCCCCCCRCCCRSIYFDSAVGRMNSSPDAEWQVLQRMQSGDWIIDQQASFKINWRPSDISMASAIRLAIDRNQWWMVPVPAIWLVSMKFESDLNMQRSSSFAFFFFSSPYAKTTLSICH